MKYSSIEDIVREVVPFNHGVSSQGWHKTYCAVCGDGSHSKGARGNWLFNDKMLFYNCFNCGIDGTFDPRREYPFSKNMHAIFKAYDIPLKDCYILIEECKGKHSEERKITRKRADFDPIPIPDWFYPLNEAPSTDVIAKKAHEHLINRRKIDPDYFSFYLSTGKTASNDPKDINLAKTFVNRLIIPAFVDDNLIGYEGMALGSQGKKYIGIGKNLIHGYNNIFKKDNHIPLYITEGFFDSYHLHGVAVTTNKLSSFQIELLERSPRPKIIVPDRNNTHNMLAEKALSLGWGIALPNIKPYKDISEAIEHYGTLFVLKSVTENIKYGKIAEISLKIYNIL